MGDYTKLIVHCECTADPKKLKDKITELHLYESAYHCDGLVEQVDMLRYGLSVTLVGQTKYGRGQKEFLDWLAPFVIQGSGADGCWAIQFNEYSAAPTLRFLRQVTDG